LTDAPEGDVVSRVDRELQVGENVLDLFPLVDCIAPTTW